MRVAGDVHRGKEGFTCWILVGEPRHRSEDNITIDLREIGLGGMDWIHLGQDRV
jgi:hypothetical protein